MLQLPYVPLLPKCKWIMQWWSVRACPPAAFNMPAPLHRSHCCYPFICSPQSAGMQSHCCYHFTCLHLLICARNEKSFFNFFFTKWRSVEIICSFVQCIPLLSFNAASFFLLSIHGEFKLEFRCWGYLAVWKLTYRMATLAGEARVRGQPHTSYCIPHPAPQPHHRPCNAIHCRFYTVLRVHPTSNPRQLKPRGTRLRAVRGCGRYGRHIETVDQGKIVALLTVGSCLRDLPHAI